MNYDINPFQVLYVTDSPDPRVFVKLFSDLPVPFALPLYRPGHVVLKGTQGTGKSMLLNLLRPRIRLAYAQANSEFPLAPDVSRFLGAGINLTRSGALDLGQRPLSNDVEADEQLFPLYFADFVNYFVVRDILDSVQTMRANPKIFGRIVCDSNLDDFARLLARKTCWFDYLAHCRTFAELCDAIDDRIACYRAFHQYNGELGNGIQSTKTNIGEPIATTSDALKEAGVIGEDVPVFVRIDQVERLYRSDVLRPSLGQQYRRIINKAVGTRDSRVFYKIGTRTHAWDDDLVMFGTQDRLEHMRDFRAIDLDEQMRRKEDTKTWLFPQFASDALYRRLRNAGIVEGTDDDRTKVDPIGKIFGATPGQAEIAQELVKIGKSNIQTIARFEEGWTPEWRQFITRLFEEDPLEAIMAAAWARQTGSNRTQAPRYASSPPAKEKPWQRPYWRKERVRQALLQLAARNQQRLKWAGREQIVNLSGGNISIFLSICHEIWDAFLRAERRKSSDKRHDPLTAPINRDIQTVGIQTASEFWYNKITEQPKGHDRQRFINVVGAEFRRLLLNDSAMSYPGWNGFSLINRELDEHEGVKRFLNDASDYGDLLERPHTTKEKKREPRTKWYLCPILSAHFQIPESHVKEPHYVRVEEVMAWIEGAEIVVRGAAVGAVPGTGSKKPPGAPPDGRQGLLAIDLP